MKHAAIASAVLVVGLTGCAVPTISLTGMNKANEAKVSNIVDTFERRPAASAVREIDTPRVEFSRTEETRIKGTVDIRSASVPFAPLISELAKKEGYSVAYASDVDVQRRVSVEFNSATFEDAVRTTAFLAGYVAVFDKSAKSVMIAERASYTYRLPAGLFSALQAQYTVGGNPANASGGSGGASAGGTSLKADFSITGKEGNNSEGLQKFLAELAGKGSEVILNEAGHISIRGNAQALRRMSDFMKAFVRDSMTQVEIEASVIEVGLSKEFALGIQWGRVVENAAQGAMFGGGASSALAGALTGGGPGGLLTQMATSVAGGGFSTYRVALSSASLITALSNFTDVKVVSQPKLVSMNNTPATFFEGSQLPYLGSSQQTPNPNGAGTTMTGTVAFAIDGLSFSAIPSVIDANTVQIMLMPVLSNVSGYETFLNDTLKAPRQGSKQTYMRVLAESGKTLILGGIRYNKETKSVSAPNSTASEATSKEIVILLRANVVPPPILQPIVSESL